jgi:hypothetical protein
MADPLALGDDQLRFAALLLARAVRAVGASGTL